MKNSSAKHLAIAVLSMMLGISIGLVIPAFIHIDLFSLTKKEAVETPQETAVATTQTLITESESTLENFVYADTTRVYVVDSNGTKTEITSCVTNYLNGELYLSPDGLERIFNLSEEDATDLDAEFFDSAMTSIGILPSGTKCRKFTNKDNTLFLQEGNRYCIVNDTVRDLGNSVVMAEDGRLSIPISCLALSLGYNGIDLTHENDTVYCTLRNSQ